MPPLSQTGFVSELKFELHPLPMRPDAQIYFRVTVTNDEAGNAGATEWILIRTHSSSIVDMHDGDYWAVSYGNVQQAIIATLKDALIHRNQIDIDGISGPPPGTGSYGYYDPNTATNTIQSVTLHK